MGQTAITCPPAQQYRHRPWVSCLCHSVCVRRIHLHWLIHWLWSTSALWLVKEIGGLLALVVLHTRLHMIGCADGELNELFKADGIIVCSEMHPQTGFESLPESREERSLIPATSCSKVSETKYIVIYGHVTLAKMMQLVTDRGITRRFAKHFTKVIDESI